MKKKRPVSDEQLTDLRAELERAAGRSENAEIKEALANAASKLKEAINAGDEEKHAALEIGRLILRANVLEVLGAWPVKRSGVQYPHLQREPRRRLL
jgi:hypothetical protein